MRVAACQMVSSTDLAANSFAQRLLPGLVVAAVCSVVTYAVLSHHHGVSERKSPFVMGWLVAAMVELGAWLVEVVACVIWSCRRTWTGATP